VTVSQERRKTKGRREGRNGGVRVLLRAGIEVKRGRREGEIVQVRGREVRIRAWGRKKERKRKGKKDGIGWGTHGTSWVVVRR